MPNVYACALKRAAEIVGSDAQLATRLRVTPGHLALLLQGAAMPPTHVFLEAVDLIALHDGPQPRPPA